MIFKDHSFDPRVGLAQLIFAVAYLIITFLSSLFCIYMFIQTNKPPYVQLFIGLLFLILAIKSFILYKKYNSLKGKGIKQLAELILAEGSRGISTIRVKVDIEGYGSINVQNKYAGENIANELNNYVKANNNNKIPVIVIGQDSKFPRAMIDLKIKNGHIDFDQQ